MNEFNNKTIFITGSSRGIGRAIALKCAALGANVVIAAKSDKAHPKLPGTIHSVADEVNAAGGKALAIKLDVRDEPAVNESIQLCVETFGGLDVLVNNASAINLSRLQDMRVKHFDLIHAINERGTLVCSKAAIPFLKQSQNPHIITLSPPINLAKHWLKPFIPYTLTKYGMTLLTMGLAEELRGDGVSASTLWPQTTIATAAIEFALDKNLMKRSRTADIMAAAAVMIMSNNDMSYSGKNLIDESLLRSHGVTDFDQYLYDPECTDLMQDLFLDG